MLSKINPDPKNAFPYIENVYLNYILGLFMKKQVKAPVKIWFCSFWALFRRNLPLFGPISTFELISFKGFTKFCLFLVEKPNVFYKQMHFSGQGWFCLALNWIYTNFLLTLLWYRCNVPVRNRAFISNCPFLLKASISQKMPSV